MACFLASLHDRHRRHSIENNTAMPGMTNNTIILWITGSRVEDYYCLSTKSITASLLIKVVYHAVTK